MGDGKTLLAMSTHFKMAEPASWSGIQRLEMSARQKVKRTFSVSFGFPLLREGKQSGGLEREGFFCHWMSFDSGTFI